MSERVTLLTGNVLITGDVTWWTGQGWSRHFTDAVGVGADAEAIAASEQAAGRVVGGYVIVATPTAEGLRPITIKERIRALGPTTRSDSPVDPATIGWTA